MYALAVGVGGQTFAVPVLGKYREVPGHIIRTAPTPPALVAALPEPAPPPPPKRLGVVADPPLPGAGLVITLLETPLAPSP